MVTKFHKIIIITYLDIQLLSFADIPPKDPFFQNATPYASYQPETFMKVMAQLILTANIGLDADWAAKVNNIYIINASCQHDCSYRVEQLSIANMSEETLNAKKYIAVGYCSL